MSEGISVACKCQRFGASAVAVLVIDRCPSQPWIALVPLVGEGRSMWGCSPSAPGRPRPRARSTAKPAVVNGPLADRWLRHDAEAWLLLAVPEAFSP
jgi:hypothetical protein